MSRITEMICVVCPIGCRLRISLEKGDYHIEGNQCKRGIAYALDELTHPTRTVTSTVGLDGSFLTRLPVKTDQPFPKGQMLELMECLKTITVHPPIKCGQVIMERALGSDVNVVATRTIQDRPRPCP